MTSTERMRAASRLGRSDVVPVAPYMGNHGARVARVPVGQYCRSGRLMAEAQLRAWELYGQDAVVAQSDNYYIAEGFGAIVQHHTDDTPTLQQPAIRHIEEVYRLTVPNPETDGRMPVYLEAIRLLAERFGGCVAVRAPGTGPFSLASHLLGTERFLVELAMAQRDPEGAAAAALRCLLDLTTKALIGFSRACLQAGATVVQAGDSLASPDMIAPSTYRIWAWPWECKYFEAINDLAGEHGAITLLHICGDTTPILEWMADTGAQVLELDARVELRSAKQKVGRRVCLMGNLDPVETLWRGSVEEVEQASLRAIREAGDGGGFILGSGCEVPVAAPRENLAAMIRVARAHRYRS